MSVRADLHLDNLLQAADDTWPQWTRTEPLLTRFASHREIAQWRMDDVDWQEDREVFLALGRLTLMEESRPPRQRCWCSWCCPPARRPSCGELPGPVT